MTYSTIIGVISIKGGVGKTTTVANLGAILAEDFKRKVLIIDANFSAPNLGIHLGLVNPEYSVQDVLNDKIEIKDAIYEYNENLHILPASLINKRINPLKLKDKIKGLRKLYDVILLDSSPNLNDEMLSTMLASDELLVVSTPDYPTLSSTMHAVKVARQRKTPIVGIVLNKIRNKAFELSVDDVENAASAPVLAVLNDDVKFLESLSKTVPAAVMAPNRDSVVEYKKLAGALIGKEYADKRVLSKITGLFKKSASSKLDASRASVRAREAI